MTRVIGRKEYRVVVDADGGVTHVEVRPHQSDEPWENVANFYEDIESPMEDAARGFLDGCALGAMEGCQPVPNEGWSVKSWDFWNCDTDDRLIFAEAAMNQLMYGARCGDQVFVLNVALGDSEGGDLSAEEVEVRIRASLSEVLA